MKTLITLLTCITLTISSFAKGHKHEHAVHVLSARMNIVHLKLDREYVGATLEIYNEEGKLISTQVISERKVLIDFDNQANGIYTIKMRRAESEETLNYINFNSHNTNTETAEPLTIIQGI